MPSLRQRIAAFLEPGDTDQPLEDARTAEQRAREAEICADDLRRRLSRRRSRPRTAGGVLVYRLGDVIVDEYSAGRGWSLEARADGDHLLVLDADGLTLAQYRPSTWERAAVGMIEREQPEAS